MRIFVCVKQIGKRKPIIGEQEMQIIRPAATLQEMIGMIIAHNVEQYNNRKVDEWILIALSEQDIQEQAEVGKVGFRLRYNPNQQDLAQALENAELSFRDGLYKVFINNVEVEHWHQAIDLREDDRIIFLKFTMLAGRMW